MFKNKFFLFGIFVLLAAVFLPAYTRMQVLKRNITDNEVDIRQLKIENARLREEKRRLIEDPVYLEKVAREKLGIVKEGEKIYRINTVE